MPDADGKSTEPQKDFGLDTPMKSSDFFMKGGSHLEWGMKNRLSRIFNPKDGRTLMLAFDHGYIMGPTSGIERMDLKIPPLMNYVDCLMCTRGAPAHLYRSDDA